MFHVKQKKVIRNLNELLYDVDISLDGKCQDRLGKYEKLLRDWSKRINLISKNDLNCIIEHHFIPSIWLLSVLQEENPKNIVDIGSGAGFPGLVLKIFRPDINVVLIDSIRKKTLFLKEVANQLSLEIEVIENRVENIISNTFIKFDLSVNRAVGKISKMWKWSVPLLKTNGVMYSLKGENLLSELKELEKLTNTHEIIFPDEKWIKISPELKNKRIIRVKRNNEGK